MFFENIKNKTKKEKKKKRQREIFLESIPHMKMLVVGTAQAPQACQLPATFPRAVK